MDGEKLEPQHDMVLGMAYHGVKLKAELDAVPVMELSHTQTLSFRRRQGLGTRLVMEPDMEPTMKHIYESHLLQCPTGALRTAT